ncbi:MAG TPA: c-type cytochrome [Pirellulales bacterium]|nr:c-type cytochrome [Pirellulales bacterium]
MPRWYGPAAHAPHPRVFGPFETTWSGRLLVPFDTSFTFLLTAMNPANAKLVVAGKSVTWGEPVELPYGAAPFELRAVFRDGMPRLRLDWQCASFGREPIGPRFFAYDPAAVRADALSTETLAARGSVLAESFGCFRCHDGPRPWLDSLTADVQPQELLPGPQLDKLSHRLHRGWVETWLANPRALRPGTRMPAQFADTPQDQEALRTIAAYLTSGQTADDVQARPAGSIDAGQRLYAEAGCAACHEPPESLRDANWSDLRVPALTHLVAKWTSPGLCAFLEHPLETRAHGRMPEFAWSAQEANDLAAYLFSRSPQSEPPPFVALPPPKDPQKLIKPRPAVAFHFNEDEFEPVPAKFVRFTIRATTGGEPGIDELEIYGDDPLENLALAGKATASSELPGYEIHKIKHLNDGRLGNGHSWISNEPQKGWAQIELPEVAQVRRVVWARDREQSAKDRLATSYLIELSLDGEHWRIASDESDRLPFSADAQLDPSLAATEAALFADGELERQWAALGEDAARLPRPHTGLRLQAVALRQMALHGCLNCHDAGPQNQLAIERRAIGTPKFATSVPPPAGPSLAGFSGERLDRGCLSRSGPPGGAPQFELSDDERAALAAYLGSLARGSAASLAECVRIEMRLLNCAACHQLEAGGGEALTALLGGEEAARWVLPPHLAGVAARLRPERLDEYLRQGARRHRLRPWTGARMPGFGGRGGRLAAGLCARDGADGRKSSLDGAAYNVPTVPPGHLELGRFLVSRKAMACTNCHRFNGLDPTGPVDPTTRGPDLGLVAAHVRHDYFQRLVRNPSRFFPNTKMPQIFKQDGSTTLPALAELPRELPAESLWSYLSLGASAPPAIEEQAADLLPKLSQPLVQRGLVHVGEERYPRGIAVGFASGTVLYDADQLSPVALWHGGFVTRGQEAYFGLDWRPSVSEVERLDGAPHMLEFKSAPLAQWQSAPLPLESDPNEGSRFDGYTIDHSAVTLRYRLLCGDRQVAVAERVRFDDRPAWRGLARELTLEGFSDQTRLAALLPAMDEISFTSATDATVALAPNDRAATPNEMPMAIYRSGRRWRVTRIDAGRNARWVRVDGQPRTGAGRWRVTMGEPPPGNTATLRIDAWSYSGSLAKPSADELASLADPARLVAASVAVAAIRRKPPTSATVDTATLLPGEEPFAYKMEAIPAPADGWRPSGTALGPDGTLYALSMTEGRIYKTQCPPLAIPKPLDWQLYASGLNHPLGLSMVDGRLFVAQKPEITELVDRDADGMVNAYRTVAGPWGLSYGWHEYDFGLAVDRQKRLYVALNTGYFWTNPGYVNPGRFRGSVLRADLTGRVEEVARGFRVPNGIARGADGEIFACDNQGDWIQVCKVAHIQPGRFYGHPEYKEDALPAGGNPDGRTACWLPYEYCRSAAGLVADETEGKFGPFAGQMFVGDVGYGNNPGVMRVALEQVEGEYQGACFRFLADEPFGPARLNFAPDGRMYISSMTSGLTRLRFGGKAPMAIHHVNIRAGGKGFVVHFTQPLAGDVELGPGAIRARRWNYVYSGNYGSPKENEADVPIERVEVSADRRSLVLTLDVESHPIGRVYNLNLGPLHSATGDKLEQSEAWYTVQRVPSS